MTLPRVLEPEVMDSEEEAMDYDAMDHSDVNERFVTDFLSCAASLELPIRHVFDVGTGTARIPIALAKRVPALRIDASDLSVSMVALAKRNLEHAGVLSRVRVFFGDAKELVGETCYDAVFSNSLVHHLPNPALAVQAMWTKVKPGGLFFLRDLARPDHAEDVERLVTKHADAQEGDARARRQQSLFRDSLHAALTVEEIRDTARDVIKTPFSVGRTSDRHWTLSAQKGK